MALCLKSLTVSGMASYPDLIERVLLVEKLLQKLMPTDVIDREVWWRVRDAEDSQITGGQPIGDPAAFRLVRGGLLYLMDDLEGGHKVFQDATNSLGSYWHGMIHRREGDFDNARYWFRRAGELPFFQALHHVAAEFCADMAKQLNWDPYLFTGLCEQARFGAEDETGELPRLQRAEFDVVFDYCWRQSRIGEAVTRPSE